MISLNEYQERRHTLAKQLPANTIAIIPAASERLRNGDAHYRFRQDSDFYYLTGCTEPDALLLINSEAESFLFNRPRDALAELWTGTRLGQEGACEQLGIQHAFPMATLEARLPELLAGREAIYYPIGRYARIEHTILTAWQAVKSLVRRGVHAPEAFFDLMPILSEMRLFKSPDELACMQKAAHISVQGHKRAMQACKDAHYEFQLEAELSYEFLKGGCRSNAYDPIVAGGNNACILHYTDNNKALQAGELVLIDAGGEYESYAADITRTFPVNGQFSSEQRLIYELVLSAQKAGIACVQPGCAWDKIQQTMVEVLTNGLIDLGILQGHADDLIEQQAYKIFYMHQSGHWLGLDVHDCGAYKIQNQWRTLEPGMVLTVEPGLYISNTLAGVDERWLGIGVRIEDDIAVTVEGHHNLSQDLPVEVLDIEALCRG